MTYKEFLDYRLRVLGKLKEKIKYIRADNRDLANMKELEIEAEMEVIGEEIRKIHDQERMKERGY